MEIAKVHELFTNSSGVCTDTRKIQEGNIYFALKGENFNGNKFAQSAIDSGASFSVIDEKEFQSDSRCILVEDVLSALQELANFHRKTSRIPFIGITGSNGKTTTTLLIHHILSEAGLDVGLAGNVGKSLRRK